MTSKLVFSFLLCTAALSATIIKSDLSGEYLADGDPITQSTISYGTSFPVPSAVWIWGPNWNSVPAGETRVFIQYFRLNCKEPITLYATADNYFKAYLNGNLVLTGNNWQQVYKISTKSNLNFCGRNQLRIEAENWHNGSPSALIYAITQDQSCLNCRFGTFNFDKCECDCANQPPCQCKEPQVWLGYPQCKCGCKYPVSCIDGYYFNERVCRCQCIPRECPPNQFWDSEQCQCVCKKQPQDCVDPYVWDQKECKCDCVQNVQCEPTYYYWNEDKCRCLCKPEDQIECPRNSYFDPDRCRCICEQQQQCRDGYYWDENQCRCVCKEQFCPKGFYWDTNYCKCLCSERPCLKEFNWDPVSCQCGCNRKQCLDYQWWNEDLCQCESARAEEEIKPSA